MDFIADYTRHGEMELKNCECCLATTQIAIRKLKRNDGVTGWVVSIFLKH